MSFLRKLLGLSEPESLPRVIPTSHWAGYFATLIAAKIAQSGLRELPQMAAFINRRGNRPGLCGGDGGKLPNMTDDPDVLVYCYLKDNSTFTSLAPTIERLTPRRPRPGVRLDFNYRHRSPASIGLNRFEIKRHG